MGLDRIALGATPLTALNLQGVLIVLAVAFVPPILFALAVARSKVYRREPGYALRRTFVWGATIAAGIALVLNTTITHAWARPYLQTQTQALFFMAVLVAPVVEELAKVAGLATVRHEVDEPIDGMIYGAIAGLGFSATENLYYEVGALLQGGTGSFVFVAAARTFSSSLLHATASGIAGYGVGFIFARGHHPLAAAPYIFAAMMLHAGFNFLASSSVVVGLAAFVILTVGAITGYNMIRARVRKESLRAPHRHWVRLGRHRRLPKSPDEPPTGRPRWRPAGTARAHDTKPPGEPAVERWVPEPSRKDER